MKFDCGVNPQSSEQTGADANSLCRGQKHCYISKAMNPDVDSIRARQKRISDEIEKLQKELDELGVALRVLGRFAKAKPPDKPPKPSRTARASKKVLPPRPKGIPSTFEMVEKILTAG